MTLVEFFKRNRKQGRYLLVRTLSSVVKSSTSRDEEATEDCTLNVVNYTSRYESSLYSIPVCVIRNKSLVYYYHGRAFHVPAAKIRVSEELSNNQESMYGLKSFNPWTGSLTALDCTEEEAIKITERTLRELEEGQD